MAWIESVSPSFRARHDSAWADDADRVLHSLEQVRDRLARLFLHPLGELTVVLHRDAASLSLSNPVLPLRWIATAPAARRYLAGWSAGSELHVLAPEALQARASRVPGSREMLLLAAPALYARRVIAENNSDLPRAGTPARALTELRWAWLLDGGGGWLAGQTAHSRGAVARRLREGGRPSFPPGVRDAALLGGTVIDLLAHERGESAAAQFVTRLHPQGARPALTKAFGGERFSDIERAWRSHLARTATAA
jgi:hypothetical protein